MQTPVSSDTSISNSNEIFKKSIFQHFTGSAASLIEFKGGSESEGDEMEVKKPKALSTVGNGEGFQSSRSIVDGESLQGKSTEPIDHWAFMEEIDAPMWADLTLESMCMDQDFGDSWFQVTHPFHQISSYHLVSVSSTFGEKKNNSDADLLGKSPPRLPPSVSKSRGKDYKSKKWRRRNQVVTVDKKHPIRILGRRTTRVNSVKPKIKTVLDDRHAPGSKGRLIGQSSSTDRRMPDSIQGKFSFRNPKNTSSLKESLIAKSTSTCAVKPTSRGSKPSFRDKTTSSLNASFKGKSNLPIDSVLRTFKHKMILGDSRISCSAKPNSPKTKSSTGKSESSSSVNLSSVGVNNSARSNVPNSPVHRSSIGVYKDSSTLPVTMGTEVNPQESRISSDAFHQIFGQASGFLSAVRLSLRKSGVTRQPSRVEVKVKRQSNGRKSSSSKSSVGSTSNSGCNLRNTMPAAMMKRSITPQTRIVTKIGQSTDHNNVKGKSKPMVNPNSKWEGIASTARSLHKESVKFKVSYQSDCRKPLWLHKIQDASNGDKTVTKDKGSVPISSKVNTFSRNLSRKKVGGKENIMESGIWVQKASNTVLGIKDEKGVSAPKAKAVTRNIKKNMKNSDPRIYFR